MSVVADADKRVERILVMINSTQNPERKRYSNITFEDDNGNQYEYTSAEIFNEKSRSKFFRNIIPFEYFPLLQMKNNKPKMRISFKIGQTKFNPITGKYIYQMIHPIFEEAVGNVQNN